MAKKDKKDHLIDVSAIETKQDAIQAAKLAVEQLKSFQKKIHGSKHHAILHDHVGELVSIAKKHAEQITVENSKEGISQESTLESDIYQLNLINKLLDAAESEANEYNVK